MSERYLCINCWRSLAREDTFFRCLECEGGDGRPVFLRRTGPRARRRLRDVRRPLFQSWFGVNGERLGCPKHPGGRLVLSCECEANLPPEAAYQSRKPLALGFAGPRSSGKTLMTIAMVEELRGLRVGDRRIDLNPLDDTEYRFHQLSSQFLRQGAKPGATVLEDASATNVENLRNFGWRIYVDGSSDGLPDEETFLAVYDVAGETWGIPAAEPLEYFDRYVGLLGSVVFLLDGAAVAADLGIEQRDAWDPAPLQEGEGWSDRQWLNRLQSRLGRRAKQVDLALVLSKSDYFWDLPDWQDLRPDAKPENREVALEQLLDRTRRLGLWTVARSHFRHVRLFAVSSLGFHPSAADVDAEGCLPKEKIKPVGVAEPLSWLLRQRLAGLK